MIRTGDRVAHPAHGVGTVTFVYGRVAEVEFLEGERVNLEVEELKPASDRSSERADIAFRKAFESLVLGVVPSNASQLLSLTIDADHWRTRIEKWLTEAYTAGTSKVLAGYYGAGKSHHLQLVRAIAEQQNWVTATLEFDPKSADPARPHLIYEGLMRGLTFPKRTDGRRTVGFWGLVDEMRQKWRLIENARYFKESIWLRPALEIIRHHRHDESNADYVEAVGWVAGQYGGMSSLKQLHRTASGVGKFQIRVMPRAGQTADLYSMQLVQLAHVIRKCGYAGLAIIVDEAEHVRNFTVVRREKANAFFDILARCAHIPRKWEPPVANPTHTLPDFWKQGPHFALFVGMTPTPDFSPDNFQEDCVFAHTADDIVMLVPPTPAEFRAWADGFWQRSSEHLGARAALLRDSATRRNLAAKLASHYERAPDGDRVLRRWTKVAALVPAVLMARPGVDVAALSTAIEHAVATLAALHMPWEVVTE